MWRKILRAFGCLGYLAILGAICALVAYVAFSLFVRRGVTPTPEVTGLPEAEATALLNDQGLRAQWSEDDDRYDEEVPAGHVLMQRPRGGTLVKRGSTVTLVLSRGPQLIVVPDLVGGAPQAAQVTLSAAGLTAGRTLGIMSDEGEPGTVIAQRPAAGSRAEQAAAVDVFVAVEDTRHTFVMPDLVDYDYEIVRRFFTARGFRIGRVSYEEYEGIAPGTVLRQFPPAGHPLRRGAVIALSVAAPDAAALEAEALAAEASGGTMPGGTMPGGTMPGGTAPDAENP